MLHVGKLSFLKLANRQTIAIPHQYFNRNITELLYEMLDTNEQNYYV